jgi:hypothetical protein
MPARDTLTADNVIAYPRAREPAARVLLDAPAAARSASAQVVFGASGRISPVQAMNLR